MLTGDNKKSAETIAKTANIDVFYYGVLPDEKARYIESIKNKYPGESVAMVGDGINDAPALAISDVGIVMKSGSDIAIESGDVVLMNDDIRNIIKAINLSDKTVRKIKQNLFWALAYNVIGIPVAAGVFYNTYGLLLSPVIAGSAMALSSVSVVLNSVLLKYAKT